MKKDLRAEVDRAVTEMEAAAAAAEATRAQIAEVTQLAEERLRLREISISSEIAEVTRLAEERCQQIAADAAECAAASERSLVAAVTAAEQREKEEAAEQLAKVRAEWRAEAAALKSEHSALSKRAAEGKQLDAVRAAILGASIREAEEVSAQLGDSARARAVEAAEIEERLTAQSARFEEQSKANEEREAATEKQHAALSTELDTIRAERDHLVSASADLDSQLREVMGSRATLALEHSQALTAHKHALTAAHAKAAAGEGASATHAETLRAELMAVEDLHAIELMTRQVRHLL